MTILYHGTNKEFHDKVVELKGTYTHKAGKIEFVKDLFRNARELKGCPGLDLFGRLNRAYENYNWVWGNLFFAEDPSIAAIFAHREGYTPILLKIDTDRLHDGNGKMKSYQMSYGTEYQLVRGSLDSSQYEVISLENNDNALEMMKGKLKLEALVG